MPRREIELPNFGAHSLADTLRDVADLDRLCAPRQVPSNEIFAPNAAYGHDLILKAWAGWPADRSLKLAMPHGIEFGSMPPNFSPVEHVAVVTYAQPERVALNRAGGITARQWPMAMPYAYLLRQLPEEDAPTRTGMLFFPAHSTPVLTVSMDWSLLADAVASLPDRYHPITACIYHSDFVKGRHQPFVDRGIRVVSAGHPLDPLFLARLHHLCLMHEHTASNDTGSALFYAMYSGCRYIPFDHPRQLGWRLTTDEGVIDVAPELIETYEGEHWDVLFDEWQQFFRAIAEATDDEQLRFAQHHMGHRYLLPPNELRRQLLRAELVDQLVTPIVRRGRVPLPLPPAAWRRVARRVLRRR